MRFRKLKDYEKEFCELNTEMIEIKYYPKFAKKHHVGVSVFRIQKGYALIYSKKLVKHFKKCQIISIKVGSTEYIGYNVKQVLLGGD